MTENEKRCCAVVSMGTGTAMGTGTDMSTSTSTSTVTDTNGSRSDSLYSDSLYYDSLHSERLHSEHLHSEHLHSGSLLDRNATTRDWPLDRCIPELFEAQVARTPDAVALIYDQQQFTYDQLNRRANQLAHHLRSQGVQAESLVGICIDRSFDLFIGLLAILKAGGAYLPLDPNYPAERLAVIVEDAQPVLLLGQRQNVKCLPDLGVPRIWIEDWGDGDRATLRSPSDPKLPEPNPSGPNPSEQNLPPLAQPHNLAYIIYTSGSTGKPKGVIIEHRSLVNFCWAAQEAYGIGGGDRVLQFSTINFDLSVEQIFPYLISGGSLALRTPDLTESIPQFLACCDAWGVTVLDLPTAYWNLLIAEMVSGDYPLPRSIRRAIIIGEPANPEQVAQWQRHVGQQAQLINAYGPTEATVAATQYWVPLMPPSSDEPLEVRVSVGHPMGNMQIYLLDQQQQQVPEGAIGEICIGGLGVARGYLNRPERNADRFVPDPWSLEPGARLYRTGDLGCYRPDGRLDCLGRMDNQIKLRGYRIELGEIETCLHQHPAVKQAVVIVRADQVRVDKIQANRPGQKRLVAYWVAQPGQGVSTAELRQSLSSQLPDYMVPAAFVCLEALPLNPNGKVDRAALPTPSRLADNGAAIAPPEPLTSVPTQTSSEQPLVHIWQTLLGIEGIQPQSNFFELGGDSLSALRLLVQLEKQFGTPLTLSALFQAPTLAALAQLIDELRSNGQELVGQTGAIAPTENTVMPLKPSGRKPPFFFINAMSFATLLAPHFGSDSPVYGINIFGATERLLALPEFSLGAIAQACVADLRQVQPQGPYFLGGYCDNSKLAFEIAQCLQRQGETVALLAFLDATWEAELQTWQTHRQNLREFGLGYIREKIGNRLRVGREQLKIGLEKWRSRLRQAQGQGATEVGRDIQLLRRYESAAPQHQPEAYAGAIDCFLCSEMRMTEVPLVARVARSGVRIHTITGYHHTLFEPPHVQHLAQQLEATMDAAMKAAGAASTETTSSVSVDSRPLAKNP